MLHFISVDELISLVVSEGFVFELSLSFGKKAVGVAGGVVAIESVAELLQKVRKVDGEHGTVSQLFDAARIAGKAHLVHASRLALIAQATKTNFASSLGIELMCWVAAERQINKVFDKVGLREDSEALAVLTVGDRPAQVRRALGALVLELGIERDDGVLEISPRKIPTLSKIYSIPKPALEISEVQKLVLERVSLLALER